jgi:hypothetical protein
MEDYETLIFTFLFGSFFDTSEDIELEDYFTEWYHDGDLSKYEKVYEMINNR